MAALVQIAENLSMETDSKGRDLPAIAGNRESKARASIDEFMAGADQAKRCSHKSSSGTLCKHAKGACSSKWSWGCAP